MFDKNTEHLSIRLFYQLPFQILFLALETCNAFGVSLSLRRLTSRVSSCFDDQSAEPVIMWFLARTDLYDLELLRQESLESNNQVKS